MDRFVVSDSSVLHFAPHIVFRFDEVRQRWIILKADPAFAFVETNVREELMVSVDVPLLFTTRRIDACTEPSGYVRVWAR